MRIQAPCASATTWVKLERVSPSSTGSPVVLAVYAGDVAGGALKAGHDAADAALFPPDALPPLPFPHDERIVEDWRALLKARRGAG